MKPFKKKSQIVKEQVLCMTLLGKLDSHDHVISMNALLNAVAQYICEHNPLTYKAAHKEFTQRLREC